MKTKSDNSPFPTHRKIQQSLIYFFLVRRVLSKLMGYGNPIKFSLAMDHSLAGRLVFFPQQREGHEDPQCVQGKTRAASF